MRLPEEILSKILDLAYDLNKKEIAKNFRKISDRYIGEKNGESLLNQGDEAIAYAIARMPATYAATYTACRQAFEMIKKHDFNALERFKTLIDVGAGTGAATLAVSEQLDLDQIICLEREDAMISLGKLLLLESSHIRLKNAIWKKWDINNYGNSAKLNTGEERDNENSLKSDIVVSSYMLNEFGEEKVLEIVKILWDMTNDLLVIVEPGTPKDYARMIKMKDYLAEQGGNIVAPCTCNKGCNLPTNDWCSFVCRVERTRLQKDVKLGDVPYEDEKFIYLAVSKKDYTAKQGEIARIIRHPVIRSNMVEVKVCWNGQIMNKIYTKRDKEIYKKIRKNRAGDIIE